MCATERVSASHRNSRVLVSRGTAPYRCCDGQCTPNQQPRQQKAKACPSDCFGCVVHPAYLGSPSRDWYCAIRGLANNNPPCAASNFDQTCCVFETHGARPKTHSKFRRA